MGTNYYLHPRPDGPFEPLHIGKSSAGWCFSLHVMPEESIHDLDDWRILWESPGACIKDEYGRTVSIADMEEIITKRSWAKLPRDGEAWYRMNHAEPGPNNLARHVINSSHCVKHGAGTWDCIIGEFC